MQIHAYMCIGVREPLYVQCFVQFCLAYICTLCSPMFFFW